MPGSRATKGAWGPAKSPAPPARALEAKTMLEGLIERSEGEGPVFVERDCQVGGILCPRWAEWFEACEDTDPDALDEERDPVPLTNFPFQPSECRKPESCALFRRTQHKGGSND